MPCALSGVDKRYGTTLALQQLSLTLEEGEVLAVTGPSGAGKSTLGRLVSGLETPSAGEIALGGTPIGDWPPQSRRVAHMFESFALYPTRSVIENIASPLQAPAGRGRWSAEECRQRIEEVLELTEMSALRDRLPSQLSGGQKQRVALCRALVQDPSVFVLDEPIGHLDAKLRHRLRGDIRRRQRRLRPGTLWLTPDGLEAMAVADRMAVLIGGRLQQLDTPDAIHARPANVQVARLIGDPAMNVLPVRWDAADASRLVVGGADPGGLALPVSAALHRRLGPRAREGRLQLGLRPAGLRVLPAAHALPAGATDLLPAHVYAVEPLGPHTIVTAELAGQRLRARQPADRDGAALQVGQPVQIAFDAAQLLAFDPDSGVLLA